MGANQYYVQPPKGYFPGAGVAATKPGIMSFLVPALAGVFQNSPLFRGINAGYQGLNAAKIYNQEYDAAVKAAELAQLEKMNKAADISQYVRAGTGLDVTGYGGAPDAAMLGAIQQANQNPNINAMLHGDPLQQDQYGAYDPNLVKEYMARGAKVADSNLNSNRVFRPDGALGQAAQQYATPAGMATMQQDPALTGQISTGAQAGPSVFDSNPYAQGAPDYAFGLDVVKQDETGRHNKATEAEAQRRLDLQEKGNYYKNYPPTGGSGPSPYRDIQAQASLIDGEINQIDSDLKSLFGVKKDSGGEINLGSIKPGQPGYSQGQALLTRKAYLQAQRIGLTGGPGGASTPIPAPFGGGSKGKLDDVKSQFKSKWGLNK